MQFRVPTLHLKGTSFSNLRLPHRLQGPPAGLGSANSRLVKARAAPAGAWPTRRRASESHGTPCRQEPPATFYI